MPELVVLVNEDDPTIETYLKVSPWRVEVVPAGSRFCDTWRHVMKEYPHLDWYGMLGDDHVAQTPGWYDRLVQEAGLRYLAYPNGEHTEFPLMRGVCVIGGDLVRAIGWIVHPELVHNYCDVILHDIAAHAGLLKPVAEHRVDHEHWKFRDTVKRDATYLRGSIDQQQDAERYHKWLHGAERQATNHRVATWLTTWLTTWSGAK